MRLGIFAKTFAGTDPLSVLAASKAAGFVSVQYNMASSGLDAMPDAITKAELCAVADAARSTGIRIAALSGSYNMIHPDPAYRATGLRRLAVLIDAAAAIGVPMVTLCTGSRDGADMWRAHPDNASPQAWRDLMDQMALACTLAEAQGIRLGIEPELANVVDSAARARALIDSLASPSPAIVLDPANLFEVASLPEQRRIISAGIELLADRILMAHAKDRDPTGTFVAAGQGVLDYPHVLRALRQAGFTGDLVTHGLTEAEVPQVAAFLQRHLAAL